MRSKQVLAYCTRAGRNLGHNICWTTNGVQNIIFEKVIKNHILPVLKPGFHHTANATTTIHKQSVYKVEQSSFTQIALF